MFVHLVVLGFFSRPETLFFFFSAPPPHSHKKYSSLSKLRDPKQFPFRSSERKRKKKRRRDRRFLLPLENSLPTISDSTRGRTSDRIVFERVAENSFRSVVEMSPRKATFSDLARVSESDFRNWGVRERKEFVVQGSGPSIPLRLLSGVRVARDADPSTTLKKKNTTRRVPSSVGGVRPLLAKTAGHPSSDRISAEDTRACSNRP